MDTGRVFEYEAFTPNSIEAAPFRTLRLLPGLGKDSLKGELLQAQLDSSREIPKYEALSYCCGDASEVARISIGSAYLPLGHNLHEALLQLRLTDAPRMLWVDAICINQSDLDERAREVRLMHRVYQHASRVMIWLDEPVVKLKYWNPGLAFKEATQLAVLLESQPHVNIHKLGRLRKHIISRQAGLLRGQDRRKNERPPDALRLLFTRPWFERMWVVQEAASATKAVVICGQCSIDFKILMQAVEYGLRSGLFSAYRQRKVFLPVQISASPTNISAAMAMFALHKQPAAKDNLLNLLRRFHGSKSFDPRDKLFALYGIASLDRDGALSKDFESIGIYPDYRVNPTKLYIKVARGLLQRTQNLDLLSVPGRGEGDQSKVLGLPSWAPDWSMVDPDTASLSYSAPTHYSASGSSTFVPSEPTFDHDTSLTISGYFFDRISETGIRSIESSNFLNHLLATRGPAATLLTLELWISQAVEWEFSCPHYCKPGTYLTGEDMIDVYWALIMAARNQFQTQWYADNQPNHDIRPGRWSEWCARRLDRCPRLRHPRLTYPYYGIIFMSIYARGLHRFGLYDEAIVRSRTIARTERGYVGLLPAAARPGDSVTICRGGKTPIIVRLHDASTNELRLVGDAYVHGIMHGEAWDENRCQPIVLS